jgi:hypothetical protein
MTLSRPTLAHPVQWKSRALGRGCVDILQDGQQDPKLKATTDGDEIDERCQLCKNSTQKSHSWWQSRPHRQTRELWLALFIEGTSTYVRVAPASGMWHKQSNPSNMEKSERLSRLNL